MRFRINDLLSWQDCSPMQEAILNSHTCEKILEEAKPLSDIQRMYNSERRKEVQRHNEEVQDVLDNWNWKIETYPDYVSTGSPELG